ncbi:MAG: cobalt ECF transporter T component CbiQ [Desulfamplus sp.]|nr:cobalt ECF transporter T component CbiQ [Desulfamplus sp.]
MANLQNNLLDIFYIDTLSSGGTWLHNLDPRAKVMTTLIFVGTVVSFGKYEIAMLIPFLIYPAVMLAWAELPVGYLVKKMVLLMPFAFFIGIFNPLMDREILVRISCIDVIEAIGITKLIDIIGLLDIIGLENGIGIIEISGGWISFLSIMMRFCLTVGAALILICTTGFDSVCLALQKFKVPGPFIVQLMFLYRYMFVLIDEASRMVRARQLRTFDARANMKFSMFAPMIGQLLLRTLDRAQRIHLAMCCRGFDGHIQMIRKTDFGIQETLFTAGWSFLFIIFRLYNIPVKLGEWITKFLL